MTAPVLLFWGESPFLLRLAAEEALADVRPTEISAEEWRPGALSDLATPSLFGERRALLVTDAGSLTKEALADLAAYASAPAEGSQLVVIAAVSARAKGPPAAVKKALAGAESREVKVDRKELVSWIGRRAKLAGVPGTPQGAQELVGIIGEDPATLDQAVRQIGDAFGDRGGVTPENVRAQFRGFGDARIWELCDSAFSGDLAAALRTLTAMLDAREEPLAILGGVVSRLRDLIRVRALPERTPLQQLAREAGLRFDWQARRYRDQARRFTPHALSELHSRAVQADGQLKVGAPGNVVLPMVVSAIARG
ncbi:MAG TPA: DNA polymerase III subunit delta [Actinomycetota bacterium]|nr:DNA polymerase III subunit delta [Actinomycetota bacterium]